MAFSPIPGLTLPKTGTALVPVSTTVVKKAAAPGAKTTVTKATTQQAPPAAPNYATLMAQAATQASKLAAQQIAAQVKAITDQQTQLHATASAQAAEINKASLAAAQFLSGLGDMTKSDYTAAVQNLAGMTGGYTGALRDTAQQAADAAQAQLSSIPGNEQTAVNRGNDLANLVYGVSGQIPANALAVQGLGATALAREIPAQTLSYGQQQAIGQLGEGNKAADALNAQIATIRATLPSTTQDYLSTFEKTAQDQITNARNAATDALQARNINSEIAARTATGKRLTKAAAAKAKADALKNAPTLDVARSRLTGVMTSQFGKPITKTVKGVQYLQALPGFHFDNTGRSVADPKPLTLDQQSARAAEWTRVNHFRSTWEGNPLGGKITPVGGWVVSPDGQSAVPPTKPGKAFMPKVDKIASTAEKALVYIGEDGQPHFFKNASGGKIPYDPTKPAALQVKNSGGYLISFDPNTGETHSLFDDNKNPLLAGTPKAPPVVHYGKPYVGDNGNWWNTNPQTGVPFDTGTKAPAKLPAAVHYGKPYVGVGGNWWQTDPKTGVPFDTGIKAPASAVKSQGTWSNSPPDKNGVIWQTNSKTGQVRKTIIPGRVPSQAQGTYSSIQSPDGKFLWRINSVTNKVVKTPLPWPTSSSGALTVHEVQDYTDRINGLLVAAKSGIPADPNTPGSVALPPVLLRSEAIDQLNAAGYLTRALKPMAMAILNAYYPRPGAVGKNWFSATNPALSGG